MAHRAADRLLVAAGHPYCAEVTELKLNEAQFPLDCSLQEQALARFSDSADPAADHLSLDDLLQYLRNTTDFDLSSLQDRKSTRLNSSHT